MSSNNDVAVMRAIEIYNSTSFNKKKAAEMAKAPYSTVKHRLDGREPPDYESRQILTNDEELILVELIKDLQRQYVSVTCPVIRDFVVYLLQKRGVSSPNIGVNWVGRFRQRHKLSRGTTRPQTAERLKCLTEEGVDNFFNHFEAILDQYNVPFKRVWNMDETGFQLGEPHAPNCIFDKETGPPVSAASSASAWVTVLETVNAVGDKLRPMVVHMGKEPKTSWWGRPGEIQGWLWEFSESGWSNNDIAMAWLNQIMIPAAQQADGPVVLLVDAHKTHLHAQWQIKARDNGIIIIYIPPHSSHILQPLDVAVYSHLAIAYRKHLHAKLSVATTTIKRADFNAIYEQAREVGMKKQYIQAGWSKAGLYPPNRDKVKKLDQVQNLAQPRPKYVPRSQSKPTDILRTPTKVSDAEEVANQIMDRCTPTTAMRAVKLFKFGSVNSSANAVYERRIEAARVADITAETAAKARRVQRLPNVSYTREGVLQATYGTHEHWKVKFKHTYKKRRDAKAIISFKYPQNHEFMAQFI